MDQCLEKEVEVVAKRKIGVLVHHGYIISKGVSWLDAPDSLKKGLPEPPLRDEFSDASSYDQARSSWTRRVLPILAMRCAGANITPSK